MKTQIHAIQAELLKNKHASVLWVTFIAFAVAPLMGGVFMIIMRNPEALAKAGALSVKAQAMNFGADWNSYLSLLTQAVAVGGIMVFGFVASWIFGREYSDGTAKDLLALPTSRTTIIHAKFFVYVAWCFALVLSNLAIGLLIGSVLQIASPERSILTQLSDYTFTTLQTVILGTPIAFFAVWGKGYLAPLGFAALIIVFAQVIAATGYGSYFPWAVPGLYSAAGEEYKEQLNLISYMLLVLTGVAGYAATTIHWRYADQTE